MRFLMTLACMAIISVGILEARAGQPNDKGGRADEAEVQFRLGNDSLDQRRYQQALSHFFASHRLAPNKNVLVNIALCYQGLKAHVEAYRYFTESLNDGMKKAEREEIHRARTRARKHIAVLHITSDPPGAQIYIGREDLGIQGITPQTLPVSPTTSGAPLVVIVKSDHYKAKRQSLDEYQTREMLVEKLMYGVKHVTGFHLT